MCRSKINVLIIQDGVPHFRVPLFNLLARKENINLTVLCSDQNSQHERTDFNQLFVPKVRVGPLIWQREILNHAISADVVIAEFNIRLISTLSLAFSSKRPKLIMWGHGFGRSFRARFAKLLRLYIGKNLDALIFYSGKGAQDFVDHGHKQHNVFVAPNTLHVANATFNRCRRRSFLYVGRLQKRKKLKDLFHAFSLVRSSLPSDVRIEIIGDGDTRASLIYLAKRLRIRDSVTFHSSLYDPEILRNIFHRSIAYVSPGHVGLGVLHSFSYGIPVITRVSASHAPESDNLVHGQNSLLYDGTVSSLAETLHRIATTEELGFSLGHRGFLLYIEERKLEHMVAGFMDAIDYATRS